MMQEQLNDSKHDLQTISFDSLYSDDKTNNYNPDKEILLKSYSSNKCCQDCCLWWFFHSSFGINKYNENSNDKMIECICCDICSWCCEFKIKHRCCFKECGCCCFSVTFG